MIVHNMYVVEDYLERKKLISLSPSSKFILYILKQRGPLKLREILEKTLLPKRTVAYSLKKLQENGFIKKIIDEHDKRVRIYESII